MRKSPRQLEYASTRSAEPEPTGPVWQVWARQTVLGLAVMNVLLVAAAIAGETLPVLGPGSSLGMALFYTGLASWPVAAGTALLSFLMDLLPLPKWVVIWLWVESAIGGYLLMGFTAFMS